MEAAGLLFIHRRILLEFCHLRQDSVRQERKYDRVLLKALPAFLTLLVAGPYCGSYSLIMTMAYCALLVSDYRKNRRINKEWAADLAFVLGALGLYLLSSHFAVYEYRGATEATLLSTLVSNPEFS